MNFAKRKISTAVAIATLGLTASVQNAVAQDENSFVLEEVIVTAQKRSESVQDIPMSVSAFGGDFVTEKGITNTTDLIAHAPGLNGTSHAATESIFTMRGVGTAAFGIGVDSSVGVFIDDIALGRASVAASSFYDVERVEVVKGPQGTLFGRNTSAGAISVITNRPNLDENTGSIEVVGGNLGQKKIEAVANWAATDKLALRLAVVNNEMDGTWKSTTTDRELNNVDQSNIRLSALYAWSDTVETTATAERILERSNYAVAYTDEALPGFAPLGATPMFGEESGVDFDEDTGYDAVRASSRTTWDINDSLTLVSNTGYYTNDLKFGVDADALPHFIVNLTEPQTMDQVSQEFRLNGASGDIDWFVGGSYFREKLSASTTYTYNEELLAAFDLYGLGVFPDGTPGVPVDGTAINFCSDDHLNIAFEIPLGAAQPCGTGVSDSLGNTLNTSMAVYGDVAWNLTDSLKLTVGARYSSDTKDFDYQASLADNRSTEVVGDNLFKGATQGKLTAEDTWTSFDPRVALDYQLSEDVLVYASYSTGYKSGGFNQSADRPLGSPGTQQLAKFDPEKNKAIELGVKSTLMDGRARLNAALFQFDYSDLQIENTEDNLTFLIENAANAKTRGIELDGELLLTEGFKLSGNYTYLDATFSEGQANGEDIKDNSLARAPKNVGTVSAQYSTDISDFGELSFSATNTYTSKQYFDANNVYSQDGYNVVGARIGFRADSGTWGLALVGENLGDTKYLANKTFVLGEVGTPAHGSNYRLEFTMDI